MLNYKSIFLRGRIVHTHTHTFFQFDQEIKYSQIILILLKKVCLSEKRFIENCYNLNRFFNMRQEHY
jgi:hypothetical protein